MAFLYYLLQLCLRTDKRGICMTFKSKIDLPVSLMIFLSIAVVALAGAFPYFLGESASFSTIILLLIVITPIILLLILMTFNTRYIFHDDYLHAKSVIFGSKIPYRDIYKEIGRAHV